MSTASRSASDGSLAAHLRSPDETKFPTAFTETEVVPRLIAEIEGIDRTLSTLAQRDEGHDAGIAKRVAELVRRRLGLIRNLVLAPTIVPHQLPSFLHAIVDTIRRHELLSCDRRISAAVFEGFERIKSTMESDHLPMAPEVSNKPGPYSIQPELSFYPPSMDEASDLIMHQIAIPAGNTCDERRNAKLVTVSKGWCRLLGFEADEVLGTSIVDRLTEESRAAALDLFPTYLQTGCYRDVLMNFVTKSGKVVKVRASGVVQRNRIGEIVSGTSVYRPC